MGRGRTDPGRFVVVEPSDGLVGAERGDPPAGRLQNVGDPRDLVEADDGVDLGDFPGEFRRVPLREAARHHQPAAAARGLESGQVQNRLHPPLPWPAR